MTTEEALDIFRSLTPEQQDEILDLLTDLSLPLPA